MKYPDEWQGSVPEGIFEVKAGRGQITVPAFFSLAWIGHFGMPEWKPFERLQVKDVACGTGESALVSALAHPAARYFLSDDDAESLATAKEYSAAMELANVSFDETTEKMDVLFATRPLNQVKRLSQRLKAWGKELSAGGVFEICCDTDPDKSGVTQLRQRILTRMQQTGDSLVDVLQEALDAEPAAKTWTTLYLAELVEKANLAVLTFMHPQMYDPLAYFNEPGEAFIKWSKTLTVAQRAWLAEVLAGSMTRHTVLCIPKGDARRMPQLDDANYRSLVPFRSPFAERRIEEGTLRLKVDQWTLPINEVVSLGEVQAPLEMETIFLSIDGKRTFEQLHRRFLPMSWDVFWHLMTLLHQNGLIHLHREAKHNADV